MTDAESLQGEWEVVSQPGVTVRVRHDRLSFLVSGEMRTSWAFTLDPAPSPKAMDLRLVEAKGVGKCKTLLALYHVKRDTLLFAYATDARPSGLDVKKPEGWDYVRKRKR